VEENQKIVLILGILLMGIFVFWILNNQPVQTTLTPQDPHNVVGGPSAGNIVLPTISLDCADTNNCFWTTSFPGFYDFFDNNFNLRYELTGNNTRHTHNQYLLITDYVDTNCAVLGSCTNVVYANDNISRLFNDAGYLTGELDPVFTGWLATPPNISIFTNDSGYITSFSDTNIWTAGLLSDNNSFLFDINMNGHNIFGARDINGLNAHITNNVYTAYLCSRFGVGCIDMTGDPFYISAGLEVLNNIISDANILPNVTLASDLGSGAKRWLTLFVSSVNTETINATGDINTLGNIYADGNITTNCVSLSDGNTYCSNTDFPIPDLSGLVPYTGATQDVDLGVHNLDTNWVYANVVWTDQNRGYGTMYCVDGNIVMGYLVGFTC
jgi:hypothetical protein